MANVIPERLANFRIYLGGSTNLLGVADLKLPSLEAMTETVKGAGIAGEYESPTMGHYKHSTLEITWRTITKDTARTARQKAQRYECYGAFQEYDAGAGEPVVRKVRIIVQGMASKLDFGKFEPGATSGSTTEIGVLYYKVDIDGKTYIEIDKLNFKCVIDGVDYLAEIRAALGG